MLPVRSSSPILHAFNELTCCQTGFRHPGALRLVQPGRAGVLLRPVTEKLRRDPRPLPDREVAPVTRGKKHLELLLYDQQHSGCNV